MSFRITIGVLLTVLLTLGCKRRDSVPAEPVWLKEPVDIVLNFGQNNSSRVSVLEQLQSSFKTVDYDGYSVAYANGPEIPFTKASKEEEGAVKNLNIFFVYNHQKMVDGTLVTGSLHDKVARHVYLNVAPEGVPQEIAIKDVYAGKYKLYVVANYVIKNEEFGKENFGWSMCDDHIVNLKSLEMQQCAVCDINNPVEHPKKMTVDKIKNFITKEIPPLYYNSLISTDGIPMIAYDQDFEVAFRPENGQALKFDLELKRLVCKFNLGFDISKSEDNLVKVADVSVTNIPKFTQPFKEKVGQEVLGENPNSDLAMYRFSVNNDVGNIQKGEGYVYGLPNPQSNESYKTSLIYHLRRATAIGSNAYNDYWIPVVLNNYNGLFNQNYNVNVSFKKSYLEDPSLMEMSVSPVEFRRSGDIPIDVNGVVGSENIYTIVTLTRKNMPKNKLKLVFSCGAGSAANMNMGIYKVGLDNSEEKLKTEQAVNQLELESDIAGDVDPVSGQSKVVLKFYYRHGSANKGPYTLNVSVQNGDMQGNYISLSSSQEIKFN